VAGGHRRHARPDQLASLNAAPAPLLAESALRAYCCSSYNALMITNALQEQCELGQEELMRNNYLEAQRILVSAESIALQQRDWDTLARLYMPLQESRRQRRQRCGEGTVCLDLLAEGPNDRLDGRQIAENYPSGQLLVAGWCSIEPAVKVRRLQQEHGLYLDTFLGAVYPAGNEKVVVIVPTEDAALPGANGHALDALTGLLPPHCLILRQNEIFHGIHRGNAQTYDHVMDLWERLHTPFLAAADAETDPIRRIEKYRQAIAVDYACEPAHQRLAEVARGLVRGRSRR
jgi:hypothetical protein